MAWTIKTYQQQARQFADMHIVLYHAVSISILTGDAFLFSFHMRAKVHSRSVPPNEKRIAGFYSFPNEFFGSDDRFVMLKEFE